jgi:hypothetical protein
MSRPFAVILAIATIALLALLVMPLAPVAVEGQTIPPYTPYPTPLQSPTPDPNGCHQPYCAPPIQTPSWVATATPAVEPGTGDEGRPTGPGIINTPMPKPQGLPSAAYLHFLPCARR